MEFCIKKFSYKKSGDANLENIPPLLKRKLSRLDRLTYAAILDCYSKDTEIVFASKFGEIDRLKKLICQKNEENAVSPINFSNSVHNAGVGQFSIFKNNKKSYLSVSSGESTFISGLLAAACKLKDEILYVCADFEETTGLDFSICILLSKNEGEKFKIDFSPMQNSAKAKAALDRNPLQSSAENFLNFLNKSTSCKGGIFTFEDYKIERVK